MNVNLFMKTHINEIKAIIDNLGSNFDSHKFIQDFSHIFQSEYAQMLRKYPNSDEPFRLVNQQIARFLSENKKSLGIKKDVQGKSENIFGIPSENMNWKKQ